MESLLRKCFGARSRVKTGILTFVILSLFFMCLEAWREDTLATLKEVGLGLADDVDLDELGLDGEFLSSNEEDALAMPEDLFMIEDEFHATSGEATTSGDDGGDVDSTYTSDEASTATASSIAYPALPAVIAALMKPEDGEWMNQLAENFDIYPYLVMADHPDPALALPANKGREAMTYLTYLIDHYDNLPAYAIFIHGHRKAWHQKRDMLDMIRNLQTDALEEVGYISFRCSWAPSCPAELRPLDHDAVVWGAGQHLRETEDGIVDAWSTLFPDSEVPHTLASPCCAQFAVSRAAMMTRSKDDYIRLRNWLLDTELDDEVSGRVLEKLWAFLMTNEPVHCPAPNTCACKYFGHCGKHYWPSPPKELGPLPTA